MNKSSNEIKFSEIKNSIKWYNRVLDFYLATRELWLCDYRRYRGVILFLGFQSVESALKASLLYWDKSFNPKEYGHNTEDMFCKYQVKVPKEYRFVDKLDPYFEDYLYYQILSRYPIKGKNPPSIDPSYIEKLDYAFCGFVFAIPISPWLKVFDKILSGEDPSKSEVFEKNNKQICKVRQRLSRWKKRAAANQFRI